MIDPIMLRSRSAVWSDDESFSSSSSIYSSRSRTSIGTREPSWRNAAHRSRGNSPPISSGVACKNHLFSTRNDVLTMNKNGATYTRRRMNFLMMITGIVIIWIFQYSRIIIEVENFEDSDTISETDEPIRLQEYNHFTLENQDSIFNYPPVHIYNSSPVKELSNGLLFPLVGTGLNNIDPRNIPKVISNQLNDIDASSRQYQKEHKTPSGGAIALIVRERTLSNTNNEALLARAIQFFNKKRNSKIQNNQNENSGFGNRGLTLRGTIQEKESSEYGDRIVNNNEENKLDIHIVTKIDRYHLGHGRTNLALSESFRVLAKVLPESKKDTDIPSLEHTNVKVHVVLQSLRCEIWDHCDEMETVDNHIKAAGPPPDSNSWKESWKALEHSYINERVKSIGVTNFNVSEMEQLLKMCKVKPHFYQGSIWNVLFDSELMALLREHNIMYHVFNIEQGIIERGDIAPNAYQFIKDTALRLTFGSINNKPDEYSDDNTSLSTRLILAWLVQRGIVVIPKIFSIEGLLENSPSSISSYPKLSKALDLEIEIAAKGLLTGDDVSEKYFHHSLQKSTKKSQSQPLPDDNGLYKKAMVYTFKNPFEEKVTLYRGYCEEEKCESEINMNYHVMKISETINPGESFRLVVYPGDEFIIFNESGFELEKVTISAV